MLNILIDSIKACAEKIEGVKAFDYDGIDKINNLPNEHTVQVFVEDDIHVDYILTRDILKVTVNIDILDKLYQGDSSIEVHNKTFKIGVVLMKLLQEEYMSQISVEDYSFMTLSDYTDNENYGVRLTVYLIMPTPVCDVTEYIDEENRYYQQEENDIDIPLPKIDIDSININPIKVKKNARRKK